MPAILIIDTGPLVAYLNPRDQFHDWAVERWAQTFEPFTTCESVLSEAIFLLGSVRLSSEPLLALIERGILEVECPFSSHREDVFRLLRKYSDVPMSLADACLVRMAELSQESQVFTLDRHFKIYRRNERHIIPLVAPF